MNDAKKKSIKNIIYGFGGQFISILFGLIVPKLIISNYGSETNGLLSSVAQIFAYITLLEAGVGGATLQALYGPVGANDKDGVSGILAATDRYYKKTGFLYVLAVIILAISYPLIVKSELSYWVIFGVIVFNGMGGAINYFFQGKYHLLLQAEGKNYIKTNLTTTVYVVSNCLKIVLVFLGVGIIGLQIAYFVLNILQMLYVMNYVKKHYPWIDLKVKPNYASISQKRHVMVHQISSLIFGNTDSVILTLFCGLKVVSVYALISSLITHVSSLINNVSNGVLFNLGQSFQNDNEKFKTIYDVFEMVYYGMMTFSLIMIFLFLNPFIEVYMQGINDVQYVDKVLPYLFVFCYWLTWSRVPSVYVINNCAGHFEQTRWRSILESAINIVVSLVAVFRWGIYGVLIGTIVALLYRTNDMIIYSAKKILHRSVWLGYRRIIINFIWLVVACLFGKMLLPNIDGYFELGVWGLTYSIVMFVGTLIVGYLSGKRTFRYAIRMILKSK